MSTLHAQFTGGAVSSSGDTAAANIYIATTGSDTTGDGTSGTPYATLAKALAQLPDTFGAAHNIHVADGIYAEAVPLARFRNTPEYPLTIIGNTTTPTNVVFTGTTTATTPHEGTSATITGLVEGPVYVLLQGLDLKPGSVDKALLVQNGAYCIFDRCRAESSGTLTQSIDVQIASIEFRGNCTAANFASVGVRIAFGSEMFFTSAGTLTITGPGTSGTGMQVGWKSLFVTHTSGTNITITGTGNAFSCVLGSIFQHRGASSTITATNSSTPSSSSAVQCTDNSSWSTTQTTVFGHWTNGLELNSISYGEATGTRTWTNVTNNSAPSQNSVAYLP